MSWPTWRRGLAPWTWVSLPGSAITNQPVPDPFSGAMVAPTARIDAWNGLAADLDTSEVYLAAAGGHADWAGNEVYAIPLAVEQPRWRMLRGPTPGADVVFGVSTYRDGRPSSTHLYYALQFVRAKGRIFKLSAGSLWGSGNESDSNVDAFALAANDWDPAGTWDAGTPHGQAIDRPYAQRPDTEDVFTFFSGSFRQWEAATGTWRALAQRPSYANNDIVQASGSAVDTRRNRLLYLRNLYRVSQVQGLLLTLGATPALSDVTFTGPEAGQAMRSAPGFHYVAEQDAFFLKTSTGGDVFRVDPESFAVTKVTTTGATPPDAVNGIYTRWLWLPRLGGFAYLPRGSSDFYFLAVTP